jgi:GT2 family glycosyltransferase
MPPTLIQMRSTPARRAARRLLGTTRRGRSARPADPWAAHQAAVEPALASRPRVHRFAQVPQLGEPSEPPIPLAVWIGDGDIEALLRTRESLRNSTATPAAILGGPLENALANTRAERVVLVRAGDVLAPLALDRLGQAAALALDAAVITCDDDRLDAAARRHDPTFRPGPSPDRWLACDDSGPLLVVLRERAAAVAGDLAGGLSWRHELALRLAGPGGEGHAHVPVLLCHRGSGASDPTPLEATVLTEVLRSWRLVADVDVADGHRRVRRRLSVEPAVEVIICLRDRPELLARCVTSLLGRTAYDRLSVALVDNGSREPETLELLDGLARQKRVRVLRDARPFNFAALNNGAAAGSSADVLVFLNNDTEITDSNWLVALLEEATRPEVGAVAPLLVYPDGTVQHAGAAIGLHGYAGHPFAGLAPQAPTPFGCALGGTRNWLAVTAACLMVERTKFEAVGRFDEGFVVAGNDVDLCLRLTASGHRSLCVPDAMLVHDESRSRGTHIDPGDFTRSELRYGRFRTVGDPFYNPNLTLRDTRCGVRLPGEDA